MADNNDQFKFDLDAKEAAAQLQGIKNTIMSIGDIKNLSGLVEGLKTLAGPIAAVAAGMLAVKASFDLAKEGEQIQKIHNQFEALADAVGVGASDMKKDIQDAIGTTEDLDDALKSAGKAMSLLGENSDKIPEFFEIAKKAAAGFGGTMDQRFDQITNAVAKGNTSLLRQIGIIVDSEKALKSYAVSIGTTVSALSEQGRQAALSEAIIAKAQDRYKNLKADTEGIETSTKKFAVAWKDAGDSIAVAFNKAFGPAFSKALEYFAGLIEKVGTSLKANFGDGIEQAAAQSKVLEKDLAALRDTMESARKSGMMYGSMADKGDFARLQTQIDNTNASLIAQQALVKELEEQDRRKASEKKGDKIIEEGGTGGGDEDKQKKLQQESKFNQELLRLSEERIKSDLELETNADEYRLLQIQARNNMIAQMDAQIAETKRMGMEGDVLTKQQADELIIQMEADKAARIDAINRDLDQNNLRAFDNQVKAAKTAGDGIAAAFAQGAAQAQASMKNYGANGQMVFKTLTTNAANAFRALGDGSKSAGEAMKGFLFASLADISEAQGQMLLASGIGLYDPIKIAQGGALIALAGLLRSQAGDAGGGGVGGSSGGGGGGASPGSSSESLTEKPELQEEKKKAVTVQIMGSYFETEQTKTRLLEMIRENTDATDFKYQQIGVGG